MGCTGSKIDNEERVARCKARKRFVKNAVAARHAFAATHADYTQALKNVGAAFRQFGESEIRDHQAPSSTPSTPELKPPPRPLFLPPPPLPEDLRLPSGTASPHSNSGIQLHSGNVSPQRVPSSPPLTPKSSQTSPSPNSFPPPPPPPPRDWDFFDPFTSEARSSSKPPKFIYGLKGLDQAQRALEFSDGTGYDSSESGDRRELSIIIPSVSLGQKDLVEVLGEMDELFMKAHESGKELGRLLESRKIHYHSNFVNLRGFDSHSSRVLQAISWGNWYNRSSRSAIEDVDLCDSTSHSNTLDKIFAWEKKLYDEVKVAETARVEYEKKSALLRSQDSKGDYEAIDKTRSAIKASQTRIMVALEGVATATKNIQKLRDEELYPQLLELLEGLMGMWVGLYHCHLEQHRVVVQMKAVECIGRDEATTNLHRQTTLQLEAALDEWYITFHRFIYAQRDYLHNLSGWLKMSLEPLELDERCLESPMRPSIPPIHGLCRQWHQALDRLPDKVALEAIKSFVAVVHRLVELQTSELHHRKKVDSLTKELDKRIMYYHNYEKKHPQLEAPRIDESYDMTVDIAPAKSPLADKRAAIDALRRKLNEENEKTVKAINDVSVMTSNSLITGLPSVFQAVTGFCRISVQAYRGLYLNLHNGGRFAQPQIGEA